MTEANTFEEKLDQLIAGYLDALQAGGEDDRERFLFEHTEYRDELLEFWEQHDQIESVAKRYRKRMQLLNQSDEQLTEKEDPHYPNVRSHGDFEGKTESVGQLGDFNLIREIGRGGMGVVYEAFQISLRRKVALKVLPFAAAVDERRLQRFKNEALSAANLHHENIVPVYAVGSERGVHYYAMQFIEGHSLSALIAEMRSHNALIGKDSDSTKQIENTTEPKSSTHPLLADEHLRQKGISIASFEGRKHCLWVAGIGVKLTAALEHAHQFGIVHRDIKPANLLLDLQGNVWITDFGLALVSSDPGLTVTGELVGTLRYSSPEQIRAQSGLIDHRTDVYSLGATLYELLTLKPVFRGEDRNELIRQIVNDEPIPPCSINPSISKDLETIILKALSKEPYERYSTAQAFSEDIQRFINNLPILARRPTVTERILKWSRRHPSFVITSSIVLTLIFVGALATAAIVSLEQKKTQQAYQRELQRAEESEIQFRLAKRSVDELFKLSEEELAFNPGAESLRKRVLTSVLSFYQEFIDQPRVSSIDQDELRETRDRVEKILADLSSLQFNRELLLSGQQAVMDELELTVKQQKGVKELSRHAKNAFAEMILSVGLLSAGERERRAVKQARQSREKLQSIMSIDQIERLHQITLQIDVAEAFRSPEVVHQLKFTDTQRSEIRAIEEKSMREMIRGMRPDMFPHEQDIEKQSETKNRRLLNLLTSEQTERWHKMTGKPIQRQIDLPHPFEFFGSSDLNE